MLKSKFKSIAAIGASLALIAIPMSVFAAGADVVNENYPASTSCLPDMTICVSATGTTHTVLAPSGNWNAKIDMTLTFSVSDGTSKSSLVVTDYDNAHCKGGEPDVDGDCAYTQKRTQSFTQVAMSSDGVTCQLITWTASSKIFKGVFVYDNSSITTEPCTP